MSVAQAMYGSTYPKKAGNWFQIDWGKCQRRVRKLQVRIVKAKQMNDKKKVRSLQRLLAHSYSAKAVAVRRATENQGKKTPGVDGEVWDTPEKKFKAIASLRSKDYQPLPLRRTYIPKSDGKKRPLGIPCMKDRAMQALYLMALEPVAECSADGNSYGFRQGRSTHDAIEQCFKTLAAKDRAEYIWEGDIRACFDKISHQWLLENIPMDKQILSRWLKAGYVEKRVFYNTIEGTPQGGIISPVLCNMTLDGIQAILRKKFSPWSKIPPKVNLIRYADDLVVTGASLGILQQVQVIIEEFLKERGLELSLHKTKLTHVADGFDFLGQNVRKYSSQKLIVTPSKKSLKNFLRKVKNIIDRNKTATQERIIYLLNPVIRGWANYHRHICSKETFSDVDNKIWHMLWNWAKRRHSNRRLRWVKDKYFASNASRKWIFCHRLNGKIISTLVKAADIPIIRHIKIQAHANPFDPIWELYFENRHSEKMLLSQRGKRKLIYLWEKQNKRCLSCHQLITTETRWHVHHIIPRHLGGTDSLDNLCLLHPDCHIQLHHKKDEASTRSNSSSAPH